MRLKSLLVLLVFALIGGSAIAQDIHFSQYYASPLTLNPALTGKFNGLWRVSAIYRDQWRGTQNTDAYMTPSVSLDFSLLKDKLKTDALGVGVVVVYDKAAQLQTMRAGLSLAYHKGLDKNGKYHLALGVQANYLNKSVGDDLIFEDELINSTLTESGDEALIDGQSDNAFDMNAGLLFDGKFTKWMTFYGGYSFINIMKHQDDFINNTSGNGEDQTPFLHLAHAGFEFEVAKKFLIIPGALFQTTVKAREINFGSTFGYKLISSQQKETTLLLGGWYRMSSNDLGNNGAFIVKGGVDFQNFRITGAYDLGLQQLNEDSQAAVNAMPNAFEIAISYFGGSKPITSDRYLFNPRF